MCSILTGVFNTAIGLLVNKGKVTAVEKLKNGDVTDQKFRLLIAREIEDVKSKLDGLARKDLSASISFLKEGVELLYDVFEKVKCRKENCTVVSETTRGEAVGLAKEMRKLAENHGLDDSVTRSLKNAKKRFQRAREKATEAFANESLDLYDRILAMKFRVIATILEVVKNPEDALAACRVCIEELHSLPAVEECFTVELKKGMWAQFSKDERRAIISATCHVNRTIYDVMAMACFGSKQLSENNWPCIETGDAEKVDPLRDEEVAKVLQKQGMEHYCVPWSFGQECADEHKLKEPLGIATNADGQYVIGDNGDITVKVFDSNGNFAFKFNLQIDDPRTRLFILSVATDENSDTYVLVSLKNTEPGRCEVQVYRSGDLLRKFPVIGNWGKLTVRADKVLVSSWTAVHVYGLDGGYVRSLSFGESGIFTLARNDITAGPDGQYFVLDLCASRVRVFTEDGYQQHEFDINTEEDYYFHLACHPSGEHVVVAGHQRGTYKLRVAVYSKDGVFNRTVTLEEKIYFGVHVGGIAATKEGRLAVALRKGAGNGKVIVL